MPRSREAFPPAADKPELVCPECDAKGEGPFCAKCGTKMEAAEAATITCPACDAEIPADAKVCPECGEKIGTDDSPAPGIDDAPPATKEAVAKLLLADSAFAREVAKTIKSQSLDQRPIEGEFAPIRERAVRDDGTARVKLIQPGWGSSGYYSAEMLERDGGKAFPKGMQMFWDHQTAEEERRRPEGSLKDLAGVLLTDAKWEADGKEGAGLYADAQTFQPYRDLLAQMAPHIGVSIRAGAAMSMGEAEGRKGKIVEELVAGKSVDFVTAAGAGGQLVELFESVRGSAPVIEEDQVNEAEAKQITEERDTAIERAERAEEALRIAGAKVQVAEALKDVKLPKATKERIAEKISADAPAKDDGSLDTEKLVEAVTETAKAEAKYLSDALGGGKPVNLGESGDVEPTTEQTQAELAEAFSRLGSSESQAKIAAAGR